MSNDTFPSLRTEVDGFEPTDFLDTLKSALFHAVDYVDRKTDSLEQVHLAALAASTTRRTGYPANELAALLTAVLLRDQELRIERDSGDASEVREPIERDVEMPDVLKIPCECGRTLHVANRGKLEAALSALLEDAKTHRQLTPTELDIERLVAGELAGPELEQLLRRGR